MVRLLALTLVFAFGASVGAVVTSQNRAPIVVAGPVQPALTQDAPSVVTE